MKTKQTFILILPIILWLSACEEEPPFINLNGNREVLSDTTYIINNLPTAQEKSVLIEDISGVNCVNCPDAAAKAIEIKDNRGKRVIIATLMPEKSLLPQFTDPGSIFTDLQNAGVNQMLNFVGNPSGLPSGMINRKDYGNGINLPYVTWEGSVAKAFQETTDINIDLSLSTNADKTETKLKVIITYLGNQSDTNQNLTLMLLENNILGVQKDRNGTNNNYIFEHVLREYITNPLGAKLIGKLQTGRVFEKEFKIISKPQWVLDNCEIVALVHSANKKEVLQSALLKFKP